MRAAWGCDKLLWGRHSAYAPGSAYQPLAHMVCACRWGNVVNISMPLEHLASPHATCPLTWLLGLPAVKTFFGHPNTQASTLSGQRGDHFLSPPPPFFPGCMAGPFNFPHPVGCQDLDRSL